MPAGSRSTQPSGLVGGLLDGAGAAEGEAVGATDAVGVTDAEGAATEPDGVGVWAWAVAAKSKNAKRRFTCGSYGRGARRDRAAA